jgi:hypothetical protein
MVSQHTRDAWIFLSIGDAGGCAEWAPLDEVIGYADANNHLIPSIDELQGAVSRLTAARLVSTDGTRTRLTPEGVLVYEAAQASGVGHIERVMQLGAEWHAKSYPDDAPISWLITVEQFEQAWSRYHAWARRKMRLT